MSDNKRNRRSFNGKGYYIALILCAAAIGISGYLYYQNANKPDPQLQNPTGDVGVLDPTNGDVQVVATEPKGETPTPGATDPAKKPMKTGRPVAGEIITGYAMDCLVYNETTRDWRVHNGIDIAAEAGTQVVASADGTVYTAYEDDAMGYTVVIRHEGGYTTKYSSLSQEVLVKAGDQVTMGQAIGYVGDTALVETTLGSHVHFSVTFQDSPMDPEEFLAME